MRDAFSPPPDNAVMPLPPATSGRKLKHTRSVTIDIYYRDDGLWDIDARLTDVKTHEITLTCGKLPANQPIHDLLLRLTVDSQSNVVDAVAVSNAVPFASFCDTIAPAYKKLIGLNLMQGFRQGIRDRLSGVNGCTHLNELAAILPTAAIQTLSFGDVGNRKKPVGSSPDDKPFELDSCHALRTDGPAVAIYYPRWATGKSPT